MKTKYRYESHASHIEWAVESSLDTWFKNWRELEKFEMQGSLALHEPIVSDVMFAAWHFANYDLALIEDELELFS